jgi:TonB family protein
MRSVSLFTFVVALMLSAAAGAQETPKKIPFRPSVPYGHGSGVVLMDLDYETGKVIAVRMVISTGSPRFDNAALAAFRRWRFKPRTAYRVRTPITFLEHGRAPRIP